MNYGKSSKKLGSLRSKAFPRPSLSEITNKSLTAATAFLLGLCPLPFSVFPFGIAFACAASPSAAFAFAGLAAAARPPDISGKKTPENFHQNLCV